jgi:FHS family Na+ dependent glucose MFS transporter 1
MLGLVVAILGPTLPYLAEQTGRDLSGVSILFTTRSLGGLIGALVAGRLYDRFRGHPIMAVTILAMALVLCIVPFVPWLGLLALAFFLVGLFELTLDVGANTLLVWVHRDNVAPYMNALHFFFGVGTFISPLIVGRVLAVTEEVRWSYWILAALTLPVMLWIARLPSPRMAAPEETEGGRVSNVAFALLIALLLALYVGAEIGFGGWVYSYAVAQDLADKSGAAYLTSAFWATFTIGRLVAILIASRLRPRHILFPALVGALASIGTIVLFPRSPLLLWLASMSFGLLLAPIFPTALSLAGRHMTITGRVTSWFFAGASLGAMSLPWLIGQLFTAVSPRAAMIAIALDVMGTLLVLFAVMVYTDRHALSS